MTPRIAVIDYGIGNLRSAEKALQRVGADAKLTGAHADIDAADAVVLPGVGNFGRCMQALRSADLADVTISAADSGRPFLGICVGMQMLFEGSEESPDEPGLGLLSGQVVLLPDSVKRPQMQWNPIHVQRSHELLNGSDGHWMYFVHSFAVLESPDALATCDYGGPLVAVAGRDRLIATQFHPEKSGRAGLAFLTRFVERLARSEATR